MSKTPFPGQEAAALPPRALASHFHDLSQQKAAHDLGLWIFLATEILFFGGLFAAYLVYALLHPGPFFEAAAETEILIGTINTAILLTSGLTAALAVKAAGQNRHDAVLLLIGITILLGLAFLAAKGFEYWLDIHHHLYPTSPDFPLEAPAAKLFWSLYWVMTGLHAVHMTVGLGIWAVIWEMARRRNFSLSDNSRVRIAGLYWAFVDLMWLFLWPLLYLAGRAG
ncbi:cytochrome c oxidase subunit 3 [Jiella marina]|uniref:cytochrome c oxidase subunit 3 n=1 Tax=Jiella sp. LLJ827 TaxID=2917712 RepID=UPI002100E75E|nr:cytochrome c oxidase subunit 3 [Jiella sp. LLJ827]MCQ0987071.1 cytochrome c oxidase subunit 3 [Jiella sp. LLJ827]